MLKMSRVRVAAAAMLVCLATALIAQGRSGAPSVQGVWRISEISTVGGRGSGTVPQPQPGFYTFTRTHYSVVRINGSGPRSKASAKDPNKPTEAEKLALFDQWDRL